MKAESALKDVAESDTGFNSLGDSLRKAVRSVGEGITDALEFLHLKSKPLEEQYQELAHVSLPELLDEPKKWLDKKIVIEGMPKFVSDNSYEDSYTTFIMVGKMMIPQIHHYDQTWLVYDLRDEQSAEVIAIGSEIELPDEECALIGKLRENEDGGCFFEVTQGWLIPK